jgi:hypothetical protein
MIMLLWFSALTLALDAAKVMEMRIRMMALGQSTPSEMFLMVTEKLEAMEDARTIIIKGGDPQGIIDIYRKIVAANVSRLTS